MFNHLVCFAARHISQGSEIWLQFYPFKNLIQSLGECIQNGENEAHFECKLSVLAT